MKTPEQMAEEYANSTDSCDVDQEYAFAYKGFLAGYQAAQQKANSSHSYDALMYNLFFKQPQKKTIKIEWMSVSDRLPRGDTKGWFVVLLETVGTLRTIGSSQFINGEWLQIREGLVLVTHWAEMPEELP